MIRHLGRKQPITAAGDRAMAG